MKTIKGQRNSYDRENRELAAIILSDVNANGGEGSLSVIWARAILSKAPVMRQTNRCGQTTLFNEAA